MTESNSQWTVDTLKEFMDQRFKDKDKAVIAALAAQEKAVQAALIAAKEAVDKANTASEKRFDSVNEFRKTLSDQATTFLPRPEYVVQHKALQDTVTALANRMDTSEGKKAGSDLTLGKLIAIIGVVGTIIGSIVLLAK